MDGKNDGHGEWRTECPGDGRPDERAGEGGEASSVAVYGHVFLGTRSRGKRFKPVAVFDRATERERESE